MYIIKIKESFIFNNNGNYNLLIKAINCWKYNVFILLIFIQKYNCLSYFINTLLIFYKKIQIIVNIKLSINLIVGYISIHPLFLYISLLCIKNIQTIFIWRYSYTLIQYIYIIWVTAFSFGASWSFYNFIWGFFWVNDFIELILLFIIICFFRQIHNKLTKVYINTLQHLIIFLTLVLIIRLGLIKTRHSFFLTKTHKKHIVYIYIYILMLIQKINGLNNKVLYKNFKVKTINYLAYFYCINIKYLLLFIVVIRKVPPKLKINVLHTIYILIMYIWIINFYIFFKTYLKYTENNYNLLFLNKNNKYFNNWSFKSRHTNKGINIQKFKFNFNYFFNFKNKKIKKINVY